MIELEKVYDPKKTEDKWYLYWLENNFFHADVNSDKPPYTIVIPPPNVTGVLHVGHALNGTIQDIVIRWKRMQGYNTLWLPGTDHAGIATQNVVERELKKNGKTKNDLGRDAFVAEVWKWKNERGSTIISQLKRLGCSCDWERERFTMDEVLSKAVIEAFVKLYEKDLIYRGNYIINWCPRCMTALADEEAEHQEMKGSIYYIRYHIKGTGNYVVVATTRPETIFGDVAVAINPNDKRVQELEDKILILPILNREIPVIKDSCVDPAFGTGIVKVTPAHDPNDFEMGKRHNLTSINVMTDDAKMINSKNYDGMDRFECRKALVSDLKKLGLLEDIKEHSNAVGHCYRCHTMVEPRLSKQWFVRMKPLAEEAIKAVNDKRIVFHPDRWKKIYLNWMENIRDWCISRQIWWGHRIPVWYCKFCNEIIVSKTTPVECPKCENAALEQDTDVLDTWFSSWLWPFSTLGWPEDTQDLKKFYPTNTLSTAQEIIFFWVARMIMAGLEFKGEIPFKDIYIHGTVRDNAGKKMSKSLGNTIDPLEIIDKFSADALRFSLILITAHGQDIFLSPEKFEIGRNFSNKIWNAARFFLGNINEDEVFSNNINEENLPFEGKWILSKLNKTIFKITEALNVYRFNEAAHLLYDFIWHDYCDWFIEVIKSNIQKAEVKHILVNVLETSLRLLHPFMPFITEELWQKLPFEKNEKSIMISAWPEVKNNLINDNIEEEFALIQHVIQIVRNVRRELNIGPSKVLEVFVDCKNIASKNILLSHKNIIIALAKLSSITIDMNLERPRNSTVIVSENFEVFVKLEGVIDIVQEQEKIKKNIDKVLGELKRIRNKLNNKDFIEKANQEVIEKERNKESTFIDMKNQLEKQLKSIEN